MRQPIDSARSQSAGPMLADAAHGKAVGPHPGAKRAIREDRQLGRRVEPVEVGGWIGLGQPERLRFGDRPRSSDSSACSRRVRTKLHVPLMMPREAVDLVGAVAQVTDDRQRRRCRRFAVERRLGALRQHAELRELRGQQRPCWP